MVHFMRNYLDSMGFFNSQLDTVVPHHYCIRLGKRSTITAEMSPRIDTQSVDSLSLFACPRPYDAGEVSGRVASIGRRLAEKGFPFATVSVIITPVPTPLHGKSGRFDSLLLGYRILTDRKCLFADPLLLGAKSTRHSLLLHDAAMKLGDLFDIRKVESTLDALSRRPYISDATLGKVVVQPSAPAAIHDSLQTQNNDYVAVPIYLKDRTGLGIDGALGLSSIAGSSAMLQGDMTLSFFNLFHSGESASLLYAGDKTYQKFNIDGAKPWLFGYPMTASGSFGLEVKNNEYGYLAAQATDLIDIQNGWNVGFSFKATETTLDSVVGSGDTMTGTWRYYGADFLLGRTGQPLRDGVLSTELSLAVGGGIAERERDYSRSNVEFMAGIHAPLLNHQALHVRLVTDYLNTAESTLVAAELYRVGGYGSVRGYLDNEFAFRTVAYDQLEYLYYFSATGSAYIFCDNGFGFAQSITAVRWGEETGFLGYGIGVRLPAKFGVVTLEWARNKDDENSLGRLHVGASNE
jgi:outer membrane protein assembly factor BamA